MKNNLKEIFDYIEQCIEDGIFYEDAKTDIEMICIRIYNQGWDDALKDHKERI